MTAGRRRTRVEIDLNARTEGGFVRGAIRDADGPVASGDKVVVFEPQEGLAALALVIGFYKERFIVLDVDWTSVLEDDPDAFQDTFAFSFAGGAGEPLGGEASAMSCPSPPEHHDPHSLHRCDRGDGR